MGGGNRAGSPESRSRAVCTIHAVTIHTLDLFFAGGLGRRRCWHVGRDAARSTSSRGGTRNHTFNKPTVVITIAITRRWQIRVTMPFYPLEDGVAPRPARQSKATHVRRPGISALFSRVAISPSPVRLGDGELSEMRLSRPRLGRIQMHQSHAQH